MSMRNVKLLNNRVTLGLAQLSLANDSDKIKMRQLSQCLFHFTFACSISHLLVPFYICLFHFIYDWSELFLFSLFYSDKEDWTGCILVGSLTNWVCYPVDNEWTNSVLFESITILVFLVVTAAHSMSVIANERNAVSFVTEWIFFIAMATPRVQFC